MCHNVSAHVCTLVCSLWWVVLNCVSVCVYPMLFLLLLLLAGIKTLKEVDLAFIPYESRVFSLDSPKALVDFHAGRNLDQMADHLVTVCSMLEEYPHVRYHR